MFRSCSEVYLYIIICSSETTGTSFGRQEGVDCCVKGSSFFFPNGMPSTAEGGRSVGTRLNPGTSLVGNYLKSPLLSLRGSFFLSFSRWMRSDDLRCLPSVAAHSVSLAPLSSLLGVSPFDLLLVRHLFFLVRAEGQALGDFSVTASR